jgi:hypothetical protein
LPTLCRCSSPANATDTEPIIAARDERHVVVQHSCPGGGDDAIDVFARVEFVVVPQHEEIAKRRFDSGNRFGNRLDSGPVQVYEVARVAHHVGRGRCQLLDNLNGTVRRHQISNVDVADMADAKTVESLRPAGSDDLLFNDLDALGVVPAIQPPTAESIQPRCQQKVPNTGLSEFDGWFLAGASH